MSKLEQEITRRLGLGNSDVKKTLIVEHDDGLTVWQTKATEQHLAERGYVKIEKILADFDKLRQQDNQKWKKKIHELIRWCDKKIKYTERQMYGKERQFIRFEKGRKSGFNQVRKELEKLIKEGADK